MAIERTFLRDKEIAEMLGISKATLWRWVKAGVAPKPVEIEGVRFSRWRRDVIADFIAKIK